MNKKAKSRKKREARASIAEAAGKGGASEGDLPMRSGASVGGEKKKSKTLKVLLFSL